MTSRYQVQVGNNWVFYLPVPLLKSETPNKTAVLTLNTRYYRLQLYYFTVYTIRNYKSLTNITSNERTPYGIK